MECVAIGFPDPDFAWTKNGNPLEDPSVKTKAEKVNFWQLDLDICNNH